MLLASLSLETSKCSSFSGHFEYENYSTTPPKQDDLRVNPFFLSSMGPIFHTSSQNTPPQARTEQPHSTSPQMNTHILPTSPIAESAKQLLSSTRSTWAFCAASTSARAPSSPGTGCAALASAAAPASAVPRALGGLTRPKG